jgi:hypothetical protein
MHLALSGWIFAAPEVQHILVGVIPRLLIVEEHHFNRCAVIELLNKIAAFLGIRMGVEKRGDFRSVVLQGRAAAEQLLLFCVVIIVVNFAAGVEVVVAILQWGRLVQL